MKPSLHLWRGTIIGALVAGIPGLWIAHNLHAGPIADAQSTLASNQAQYVSVTTLIARIPALRSEYERLAKSYMPRTTNTSYWQSNFMGVLQREVNMRRIRVDEVSWTTQPEPLPIPPDVIGSTIGTSPAATFNEIPCLVSIHGSWRQILPALADMPKQHILMSVSDPIVNVDAPNLLFKFRADVLVPRVQPVVMATPQVVGATR